jgi:hypothetical protein
MATAGQLVEALADALGWTPAKVLSYAAALRRSGWWQPTKRGRAATPATDRDAATLLLAVLSEGPGELPDFMNQYANLRHCDAWGELSGNMGIAIMERFLSLPKNATLLDAICGVVRLYRDGLAETIVFHSKVEVPGLFDGPDVHLVVRGPSPYAEISCTLSDEIEEEFKKLLPDAKVTGDCEIAFAAEAMGFYWHKDTPRQLKEREKKFKDLKKATERGVQFKRKIGGRELTALAELLREPKQSVEAQ